MKSIVRRFAAPVFFLVFWAVPAQAEVGTDWLEDTQNYIESLAQRIEALRGAGDEDLAEIEEVKALADLYDFAIPDAEQMSSMIRGGNAAFSSLSESLLGTAIPLESRTLLSLAKDDLRGLLVYGQANSICRNTVSGLLATHGLDALEFVGDSFFGTYCAATNPAAFMSAEAPALYDFPRKDIVELECAGGGAEYVNSSRAAITDFPAVACAVTEALEDPYALVPELDDLLPDPEIECVPGAVQTESQAKNATLLCALADVINDPWSVIPDPGAELPSCVDAGALRMGAAQMDSAEESLICDVIRIINDPYSLIGNPGDLLDVCGDDQVEMRAQEAIVCEALKRPPEYWLAYLLDYVQELVPEDPGKLIGPVGPPGGLPEACAGDPTGLSCLFESLGIKYVYISAGSTWYWLPGVPLPILLDDPRGGFTLITASVEPTSEGVATGGAALKVEQTLYINAIDASISTSGVISSGPVVTSNRYGSGVVDYSSTVGKYYSASLVRSTGPVDCALSLQIEGGIQPDNSTTLYAGASASAFPRTLTLGMNGSIAGTVGASIETVPGCAVHSIDTPVGTVVDNLLGTVFDYAAYYAAILFRATDGSLSTSAAENGADDVTDSPYGSQHPPAHNKAEMAAGPFSSPPSGDFLTLYAGRDQTYGVDIQINLDLPLDVPRELKGALGGADVGVLEVEVGATPPGYVRTSLDVNNRELINGEIFGLTSEVRVRAVAPEVDNGGTDGSSSLSAAGEISFEAPDPIREVTIGIPLIGSLGFSTGIWRVPEAVTVCVAGTGACPNPGSKANDINNGGSFRIETSEPTYPYVSLVSSLGSINMGIWLHRLGGYAGYVSKPATAWAGFDTEKTEIGGGLGIDDGGGCADGCGVLDAKLLAWFDARQLVVSTRYPWFSLSGAHGCHSKSSISIAGKEIKAFKKLCGLLQFGGTSDAAGGAYVVQGEDGTDLTVIGDIVLLGNPACQRANTHLEDAPLGYIPAGLVDELGTTPGDSYYNPAQIVHQSLDPVYRIVCPAAASDEYDENSPFIDDGDGGGYDEGVGNGGGVCANLGNPTPGGTSVVSSTQQSCL